MQKKQTITKLKKRYLTKIITIFLWIFIGFLVIRGIGTIVRPNSIDLRPFKDDINMKIDKVNQEIQGIAFAENFANEYLTFNGDEKDYKKRLKKYTNLEFTKQSQHTEVVYVNKIKYEWKNENLLVDLKIGLTKIPDYENYFKNLLPTPTPTPKKKPKPKPKPVITPVPEPAKPVEPKPVVLNNKPQLMYLSNKKSEIMFLANTENTLNKEENTLKQVVDIVYLRVPVRVGKKCNISGYPTFINNPNIRNSDVKKLPGQVLKEESEIKEVEELVTNFINSYYQGNEVEMKYFLKERDVLNLLDGQYRVKEIVTKEMTKKSNIYYSRVVYKVEYNGNIFDNGMEFIIIRDGDKLLIEEYNTALL